MLHFWYSKFIISLISQYFFSVNEENENLETRSRIIKDIAPFNDQTEWRPPVKHANVIIVIRLLIQ